MAQLTIIIIIIIINEKIIVTISENAAGPLYIVNEIDISYAIKYT